MYFALSRPCVTLHKMLFYFDTIEVSKVYILLEMCKYYDFIDYLLKLNDCTHIIINTLKKKIKSMFIIITAEKV